MTGSPDGARKAAAARLGLSPSLYEAMCAAGNKWCIACKRWHSRRWFGSDKSRTDGLAARCTRSRIVSVDSPGVRERRIHRQRGLEWCRRCQCWLPQAELKVSVSGLCRFHVNERAREQYALDPGPIRARVHARVRGLDPIPPWWREEQIEQFGGLCAYGCGRIAAAIDHVLAVVRGGKSVPGNLVPSCTPCNSSKGATEPWPWVERGLRSFPDEWQDVIALDLLGAGYFEEEVA